MKILGQINAGLLALERSLLITLFSLTIGLAFSQVILRNFFSVGIVWADPLLRHSVLWLGFIGASLATQQEKHIRIDLATRFLSGRKAQVLRMLTNCFTVAVCGFLTSASWTFVANEIEFQDTLLTIGDFGIPSWWVQLILPAGFGILTFRLFVQTLGIAAGLIRGSGPGDAPPSPRKS